MTERLIREAVEDKDHAIDALRACLRTGDRDSFWRICLAHMRARDIAETVTIVDLGDLRLWMQVEGNIYYAWADIALIQTDYVRFYPIRHFTNAPSHLRAESTPQDHPNTLLWQIMGNALLELERQRAILDLLEAEKAEDEWGMVADQEAREDCYLRLEAYSDVHGCPTNYNKMTMKDIALWKAWTLNPEQPWNNKNA